MNQPLSARLSARLDAISRAKTINGINYALNKNSRWERVKSGVAHGAVHLGENVAAWKVGKVVGGAIGQVAASHGADPEVARLLSETAVQALASTALYARGGKRSGTDIATHMIAQSAAAFSGKVSHTGVDDLSEMLGGSERVQAISALVAGKMAGIGTVVAAHKSGVARKLAESLPTAKTRIGSLIGGDAILERSEQRRTANVRRDAVSRKPLNLAEVDNAADMVIMGYAIAALDKYRGDSMDLALDLLRIELARMDRECGRGWTGTNPPGCTRGGGKNTPATTGKKSKKVAPAAAPTEKPTEKPAAKRRSKKAKPKGEGNFGDDFLPFDDAVKKFKKLGEGVDGVVLADGDAALKYLQGTRKLNKFLVDNLTAAGDLGIAPKIHGVNKDMNILSMELLKGFKPMSSEDDFDDDGSVVPKNLLRITKKAHDNGWLPDDVHASNVMYNPDTKDVMFVDQGEMVKNPSPFEKAQQLLDTNYYRPLIAETVQQVVGTGAAARALKKIRKRYEQALDNDKNFEQGLLNFGGKAPKKTPDDVYQKLVDETYATLSKYL